MPNLPRALDDIATYFDGGTRNPAELALLQNWANFYSTHFNGGMTNFYTQATLDTLLFLEKYSERFPRLLKLVQTALVAANEVGRKPVPVGQSAARPHTSSMASRKDRPRAETLSSQTAPPVLIGNEEWGAALNHYGLNKVGTGSIFDGNGLFGSLVQARQSQDESGIELVKRSKPKGQAVLGLI